ncbi:MAG: L,D-transpeptidase family protein [Candidatus Nanopelagicales bacterium]
MGARRPSRPATRALAAAAVATALASSLLVVPSVAAAVRSDVPTPTPTTPTPTPTPTPTVPPKPKPLPAAGVSVTITPKQGAKVGVAYPITATFSRPVQRRATAERNMKVLVNGQKAAGAWYWKSRTVALYRLQGFWPGHARISVRLTLAKQLLATTKTTRYLGRKTTTRTESFRTSRKLVAKVNGKTHRMVVFIDGKKVRSFGTSLGKPGFETRSGIKAVMEKFAVRHMTSIGAGITDPNDQYDLMAPWAVRITPTGEFVHGAPWAAGRLGVRNGSHGCTNLSTANAKWFYDKSIVGDPVVTKGTPRSMEPFNGLGAPYNLTWKQWLSRSVLKGAW